jgi:hypothetical protein
MEFVVVQSKNAENLDSTHKHESIMNRRRNGKVAEATTQPPYHVFFYSDQWPVGPMVQVRLKAKPQL